MKKKWILIPVVFVAALIVIFSCFTQVPTGHTGVVTTFGKVSNYTLDSGIHVKAPWQKIVKMDNRIQRATESLSCFSSDIQEVSMLYTLNYQISQKDAMTIYRTIGSDYYHTIIVPTVQESVKVCTAKYTAEELVSERTDLAKAIEDSLSAKLANYNIMVNSTSIENMDFTDAFTNAVEAYRMISESLTDKVLSKMYYDNWDGKLPGVVTSGSTLLQIPTGENAAGVEE